VEVIFDGVAQGVKPSARATVFGEGVRLICRKLRDGRVFKATELG
jgi:hypothetical protein